MRSRAPFGARRALLTGIAMKAGVRYRKRPHLDSPLPLVFAAVTIGAMIAFYASYTRRESGPVGIYGGTTQESSGSVPERPHAGE